MFDRIREYISIMNFIMIAYVFIVTSGSEPFLTFGAIMAVALAVGVIDWRWIFPKEQHQRSLKNPFYIRLEKNQKEILKKLEGLDDKMPRMRKV